jgi:hypothetical protein
VRIDSLKEETKKLTGKRAVRSSYSYFFEAFEGFEGQDDSRALPALKYMCLCKIMMSLVSFCPLQW